MTSMAREFLAHSVSDTLGRRIVDETLAPGQVMTLEELEEEFGVSRSVAREAVKLLESVQLVHSRRRVGIQVREADQWDAMAPRVIEWHLAGSRRFQELRWISELRRGVEPSAAGLAASRADDQQRAQLFAAVDAMADAAAGRDLRGFLRHDVDFHRTILEASGNPLIASHQQVIDAVLAGRTRLLAFMPSSAVIDLHRRVARAIADRDPGAAERWMRAVLAEAQGAMGA